MSIARTAAAGAPGLLPEVLTFSTSLHLDKALLTEDIVGSLAHVVMLARQKILPAADAAAIRKGLLSIWHDAAKGTLALPNEEDVHMAVEAELTARVGEPAGRLHTARSRNDQVALDLTLHVRDREAAIVATLADWIDELANRADAERGITLPAYTHRQRAQPVSLAYWFAAYGAMFARDARAFALAMEQGDEMPLGVGAIAGSTLPTRRDTVKELLGFSRLTPNGLDTVGNRDFALDYAFASSKLLLHASRLSADVIDFTTSEFGFARLDGAIACGSSMMPQKKNPDVFELIRGKSARSLGNLVSLLTMVKGLPGGYLRDLQEDRAPLLEIGPLSLSVLEMLRLCVPRLAFDAERCRAAVEHDYTQATDVAEALVKKGLPFRAAYQAAGTAVRKCQERGLPLSRLSLEEARAIHPAFDAEVLATCDALSSVGRKATPGSTGPAAIDAQLASLRQQARTAREVAARTPSLASLIRNLEEAPLT